MILEQLDKIQKEFIHLYREIESGEIELKPLTDGTDSFWSVSAMFDLTPLHIERARGNLRKEKILNERPNNLNHISEGTYKNNKIVCVKFWNESELVGFVNYLNVDKNIIQGKRVIIDDDEQELVSINYFYKDDEGFIIKKIEAHRSGATLEEYQYVNNLVSKIIIQRRDEFEVMENDDGITKSPLNKIIYKTECNSSGKLIRIIDEKGENIYKKPKHKKRL
ncbi:hypothetical protein [Aquimarina litoralis]|uniref:hypothetical protein n=1 Tax=Aquimarina litoralis TaxID=584605 RepID=UPI001C564815|nr:hypothetical protein [Aquimarina litoralis]MBW1296338.1 hypothetical protein [Aquimarina litoralis]